MESSYRTLAYISLILILSSWAFRTEDNDIGFGIAYKEEEKTEEIIPQKRVQSHAIVEDGSLKCARVGTCKNTLL